MPAPTIDTTRDAGMGPAGGRRPARRFWPRAILFAACVILVNALFGDRGLSETLRARRAYSSGAAELSRLKRENAALRDQVRRLRTDPAAIESVARGELGLVRPGEILVTIKDVK